METNAISVASWEANRLDIVGLGEDNQLYHKAWDGDGYYPSATGWEPLGGTFSAPAAVVAWGPNRLDVFGLGTDNQMYHKAWDGRGWYPSATDWEPLGGAFDSPPAVASWAANRLDIFCLGTDHQMYHKAWDGSAWYPSATGWEALGGAFNTPPAVVSWGPNRLDIFGLGADNQMYHKAWDGEVWYPSETAWEAIGGVFSSPPAVASWSANRLDIFGVGADSQMYHKAWDGSAWYPSATGWEALGGAFDSPPSVASWTPHRLDIFCLGIDDQMYHKAWGGGWYPSETGWEALGGKFDSPPAVVAWGANRLDIFGLGTDVQMYHKAWSGNAWYPSPTNWEALGGAFHVSAPRPSVPVPSAGLGSNSNYIFYSGCNSLLNLTVTILVTQDIVCQSDSGPTQGFGFQLNAYSPSNQTSAWQQYVIALFGSEVIGAIDNWPLAGPNIINDFFNLTALPDAKIPAGYKLKISLQNDVGGNIIGATYVVTDAQDKVQATSTQTLLSLAGVSSIDIAPIIAFELNLVGPINSESATLSSGAGTIVYEASNGLTALSAEPGCAESGYVTAETANTTYGLVPPTTSNRFTQSFQVSNAASPMIRKLGSIRPSTKLSIDEITRLRVTRP